MRSIRAVFVAAVLGGVLLCGAQAYAQQDTCRAAPVATVSDFNLQTVMELMSSTGRSAARDMTALETLINDPANGINNVDWDRDGLVDYVGCVERRTGSLRTVSFVAYPSSPPGRPTVPIAAVSIRHDSRSQQVRLEAMFALNVDGYARYNYDMTVRYRPSLANHLFLHWFFDVRPLYRPAYGERGPYRSYQPHARLTVSEIDRRRAAFQRRLRQPPVAPIPSELLH